MASPPNFHYFGHSSSYFSCVGHRVAAGYFSRNVCWKRGGGRTRAAFVTRKEKVSGWKNVSVVDLLFVVRVLLDLQTSLHLASMSCCCWLQTGTPLFKSSSGCPWNVTHRVQKKTFLSRGWCIVFFFFYVMKSCGGGGERRRKKKSRPCNKWRCNMFSHLQWTGFLPTKRIILLQRMVTIRM